MRFTAECPFDPDSYWVNVWYFSCIFVFAIIVHPETHEMVFTNDGEILYSQYFACAGQIFKLDARVVTKKNVRSRWAVVADSLT